MKKYLLAFLATFFSQGCAALQEESSLSDFSDEWIVAGYAAEFGTCYREEERQTCSMLVLVDQSTLYVVYTSEPNELSSLTFMESYCQRGIAIYGRYLSEEGGSYGAIRKKDATYTALYDQIHGEGMKLHLFWNLIFIKNLVTLMREIQNESLVVSEGWLDDYPCRETTTEGVPQ